MTKSADKNGHPQANKKADSILYINQLKCTEDWNSKTYRRGEKFHEIGLGNNYLDTKSADNKNREVELKETEDCTVKKAINKRT